jgi:hypothetical protein
MAKLISRGDAIGFTILPYMLDTPIKQELINHASDYVLGYVTFNKESGELKFTYTESGCVTEANNHWSLTILKEFPYCEQEGPWIVYSCSPENTKLEFGKIIGKYHESLHIHNWDTWAVEGKNSNIVVVTSWETF